MKVSVIIPCYNVADYIEECIQSVVSQKHKDVEVICVNNNSTDDTLPILASLKKEHPELILCSEAKPGACAARNKGLSLASGEWVQFLDADDLLLPEKLHHQLRIINRISDIDFVAGAWISRTINGVEKVHSELLEQSMIAPFLNKCGNTCSNLWKKSSLIKINGWNETLKSSQEAELMMRLLRSGCKYEIDSQPLTIVRERNNGQISHRDPESKWKQFIDIRIEHFNFLKNNRIAEFEILKPILMDFLTSSLITLGSYDIRTASDIFKKEIKSDWQSAGEYGISFLKRIIITLFGFTFFLKLKKINK